MLFTKICHIKVPVSKLSVPVPPAGIFLVPARKIRKNRPKGHASSRSRGVPLWKPPSPSTSVNQNVWHRNFRTETFFFLTEMQVGGVLSVLCADQPFAGIGEGMEGIAGYHRTKRCHHLHTFLIFPVAFRHRIQPDHLSCQTLCLQYRPHSQLSVHCLGIREDQKGGGVIEGSRFKFT